MSLDTHLEREAGVAGDVIAKARERLRDGKSIGDALVELGALTAEGWSQALAGYYGLPYIDSIDIDEIPNELLGRLPLSFAKRHHVVPVAEGEDAVRVAVADPADFAALDDIRLLFRQPIAACVASARQIEDAINKAYDRLSKSTEDIVEGLDEERVDLVATEIEETRDLLDSDDEGPIIRLVNSLIFQSAKDGASDIHIEPFERELAVRARTDGVLYDLVRPPKRFQSTIISRVKIMAGMNIAEKRLPQDGRIRTRIAGRDIDIRVSALPTAFGERIVMRLLDRSSTLLSLEDLGLGPTIRKNMERLCKQPHGIILVTGPTGSGKTTTLYACLTKINSKDRNLITVEDPIEYQLPGVGQMQVNSKIDLTFASGLRSILRQDPDVIMVGEIRDGETAEIAINASLTGHLVFSTLHTNDAPGAINRLVDMGVEPFLISSSLIGILAQRLVRRVCPECRVPHELTADERQSMGLDEDEAGDAEGKTIYRAGPGCEKCKGKGYLGRCGIHELMLVEDDVRSLIIKNADATTIRKAAAVHGLRTLRQDGLAKALEGKTTLEEVMRVSQEEMIV